MSQSKQIAMLCPLCGGDNQCAVAAGLPPESCWCQSVSISGQAREKAKDSAGERCLCPSCGLPTGDKPDAR
ncbi:cysteine-rich CWC family protein [Halioglobus sp. Uisw_031]|uniref:cysteine-rich CWC family protein n=1 Tax=Halioglobus sp. Uisw_031 TaxID=3230977 RepID=UPI0039EC43A2